MSNQDRDTHFQHFAKLLMEELPECPVDDSYLGIAYADWKEEVTTLIARRAYDLVLYSLHHTYAPWFTGEQNRTAIKDIPDMVAWPKEHEHDTGK